MEIARILDLSPAGRDRDCNGGEQQCEDQQLQLQHQHLQNQLQLQLQQHQQHLLLEQHQRLLLQEEMGDLSSSLHHVRRDLDLAAKACDEQTKKIESYSRELDTLQQERLVHVQQLRSLHADINSIEGSMKRSEQARQRELSRARGLMDQYSGLLARVNRLRAHCNLEPLLEDCRDLAPVTDQSGKQRPPPLQPQTQPQLDFCAAAAAAGVRPPFLAPFPPFLPPPARPPLPSAAFPLPQPPPPPLLQQERPASPPASQHQQQHAEHNIQSSTTSSCSIASSQQRHHDHHRYQPQQSQHQQLSGQHQQALPPPPSFQQQPPPMKACLSCHQQIHRNAPICPLCKAKSRSKHPKKQKRKADD